MKDTILNTALVASLVGSIAFGAFSNAQADAQTTAVASANIVQMGKTVVTAKRLAPAMLLAAADIR